MPEEYVQIPVPARWVSHVYARLAELAAEEAGVQAPTPEPAAPARELDEELVYRMFRESQSSHRRLMAYLANQPNTWFYTSDLAQRLQLPNGSRALAGMLGAFGRRAKNRYAGLTPWDSDWDHDRAEARYRMRPQVAEWIHAAQNDPDSPVWE